jgi:hypothetical protein
MRRWWPFGRKDVDGDPESAGPRSLGSGRLIREYCVFVSSADDVIDQRNMVESLVKNLVNSVLAANKHMIRSTPRCGRKPIHAGYSDARP